MEKIKDIHVILQRVRNEQALTSNEIGITQHHSTLLWYVSTSEHRDVLSLGFPHFLVKVLERFLILQLSSSWSLVRIWRE